MKTSEPNPGTAGTVLVVDDEEQNVQLLSRLLTGDGYRVRVARDGMPKLNGFEVCRTVKQDPETRLTPVVLLTSLSSLGDRIEGIDAGADDFLPKPFDVHELRARVRSLRRVKRYTDELDSAEAVIISLALTIEARDAYTDGHCQRLAAYATTLGAHLGLGRDELEALRRGGFLHDLGKIGVPDAVLSKPAALTATEREMIQQHPVIGDTLCGRLNALRHVRPIVRHHHERLDGTGYPDHLRGDTIPLLAQITSVVDIYDALTTDRPYRTAMPADEALDELQAEARRGWRRADLVQELFGLADAGRLDPNGSTPPDSPGMARPTSTEGATP